MEYVFIPLDKIKIVEKFIDDYPIYLDFKSFVKNKDEKLYKKLPLYLVCEEKIINNNSCKFKISDKTIKFIADFYIPIQMHNCRNLLFDI